MCLKEADGEDVLKRDDQVLFLGVGEGVESGVLSLVVEVDVALELEALLDVEKVYYSDFCNSK